MVFLHLGWLEAPGTHSLTGNAFANLLLVQTWGYGRSLDPPAWSISAEWAAYLIFPLLLVPTLFRGKMVACSAGLASFAALFLLVRSPDALLHRPYPEAILDLHEAYHALPLARCLTEFTLGLMAFRFKLASSGSTLLEKRWSPTVLSVLVLLLLMMPRSDLLFVTVIPLWIVSLSAGDQLPQRWLSSDAAELAGTLSYSIYLVHELLGGLLGWLHRLAEQRGVPHAQSCAAIVCFLLTFPISWLAYHFVEAPGRELLRSVFEKERV